MCITNCNSYNGRNKEKSKITKQMETNKMGRREEMKYNLTVRRAYVATAARKNESVLHILSACL
jgi:hypothetical protein